MFANGTEYMRFEETNCDKCPHYVHYEDANENNPVCSIEESIGLCGITSEKSDFPYEWLDENGTMSRYDCRKRLGLNKKECEIGGN